MSKRVDSNKKQNIFLIISESEVARGGTEGGGGWSSGWAEDNGKDKRGVVSKLDFHIWNANWPMKCEANMATDGG